MKKIPKPQKEIKGLFFFFLIGIAVLIYFSYFYFLFWGFKRETTKKNLVWTLRILYFFF